MNVFEAIREKVTAEQAARAYGLKFGRNGRARCPWHDDHNPDLRFYENGSCYCFACHNGGDAISLTCQLFAIKPMDAVRKLNADFRLGLDVTAPVIPYGPSKSDIERERREREQRRWIKLCDDVKDADDRLQHFDMETAWDNPEFVFLLRNRSKSDTELDVMWDDMRRE